VTLEREFVVATRKAVNMTKEILIKRYEFMMSLTDKREPRAPRSLHAYDPSSPALGCADRLWWGAGRATQPRRAAAALRELALLRRRNTKQKKK